MNNAEIITIGDEILIGQTIDTNSAWMGTELNLIGISVNRITSISDRREEIKNALSEAIDRAEIVLITGGLGPTSDDITKDTLAEFFGAAMVMNPAVLEEISARLRKRNLQMNENNRRQALVPDNCTVLMNRTGTAPGMMFVHNEKIIVSMPGVPYEMKHIMTEHVLPLLSRKFTGKVIMHKNIMTYGTFEAKLAEMLVTFERDLPENIRLAYLPAMGVIKLRLTATGNSNASVSEAIAQQVRKLYKIIPGIIYGEDEVMLEEATGILLAERSLTLSTAESCTGGRIASLITSVPGSSAWFRGSVVAYDNRVKTALLGVRPETLRLYGAVSAETAGEMARGIRRVMETDYSVAVTGIAGPSGGTPEKPVGTVWIAIDSAQGLITEKHTFADDRLVNIARSSYTALNMLRKQILST
ncbi:MAG: competence/damage-inducible protein A [Bacteroidales bacterium]|jgi:nicotinamide-nucleotide amidase|nr:competence/damage-inducible protein A [Bacteroidales bacterium]